MIHKPHYKKSYISMTKTYCHGLMKPWPSVTVWGVAKGFGHGFLSDRDHMNFFLWRSYKKYDQKLGILCCLEVDLVTVR